MSESSMDGFRPRRIVGPPWVHEHELSLHWDDLYSVAWSPDGTCLASASKDHRAIIWNATSGEDKFLLEGHEGWVYSTVWSPDGTRLATASGDWTARIWDVETGNEEHCLEDHKGLVCSVAWRPDGTWLATASNDRSVRIWDAKSGKKIQRIIGHEGPLRSIAWSPDGSSLASASDDRTVRIWNASTGNCDYCLKGHKGSVRSVSWSPDGSRLASASDDWTIRIWNTATGREERRLDGHEGWVYSAIWSPDGTRLASASGDWTARIWNARSWKEERLLKGHGAVVRSIAWSPDGAYLASASGDKTSRVWDTSTGHEYYCLKGHNKSVRSIAWSPDGVSLASASSDGTVRTWRGFGYYSDDPLQHALEWSEEKSERLHSAAKAWGKGDVYNAWKQIEETCQAPWVGEVLSALDLTEATRTQRSAEEEAKWQAGRARKIREAIQQKIEESLDTDDPPPLEETLAAIKRFLLLAPAEDEAIAWLRDSARHTLERQKNSKKEALKVAILGEFSSGKSRLINALLEEKILSVGLVPVTRSVTRIVHGKKIRVTVKHMDGTTVEVAPDQLKAYTDERKKEEGVSEVEEVILEHPSPILKQVEIWDTPGFNSNNQLHDQVASQLMLEADAVLWVIAGHQVGSRSETKLLETVKRAQGKVVGVLNQVDRLENEEAIERQKQEVWTHYGEMVKEVVTTSGKWLEEEKPQGNRQELLAEIEKIGSWSQEQRARKTARRVAAVAARCKAYSKLVKKEASEIRSGKKEAERQQRQLMKESMNLWKEAKSHRDRYHTWSPDSSDQFWKINCSTQQPLTDAYKELLTDSYSKSEELSLLQSLAVLEETHWHLAQIQPVPWRDDFLLAWKKGAELQDHPEIIFTHSEFHTRSNHVEILRALTDKQTEVPEILRVTGDCKKISTFKNRLLAGIREIKEKEVWIRGLNQDFLDLDQFPQAKVTILKELYSRPRLKASAHHRSIPQMLKILGEIKASYRDCRPEVLACRQLKTEIDRQEKIIEQKNQRQRKKFNRLASKLTNANSKNDQLQNHQKKVQETIKGREKTLELILEEKISARGIARRLEDILNAYSKGWLFKTYTKEISPEIFENCETEEILKSTEKFNQFIQSKSMKFDWPLFWMATFLILATVLWEIGNPWDFISFLAGLGFLIITIVSRNNDFGIQREKAQDLIANIRKEIGKNETCESRLNKKCDRLILRQNTAVKKLKTLEKELRKNSSRLDYLRVQFENLGCDMGGWPKVPSLQPYKGDDLEKETLISLKASLPVALRKMESEKKRFGESLESILREHNGDLGVAK